MTVRHTLRQGECVESVAWIHGFLPDTLWLHADNADLRTKRPDRHTLLAGDVLVIPDKRPRFEAKATEKRHRFLRRAVPANVRIVLQDFEGKPRASLKYKAVIDGTEHAGQTDSDGALELAIPPNARDGKLLLGERGAEVYHLELGGIDPIETLSGGQQRLTNLGFACDSTDGRLDDTTLTAIRQFQEQHQLRATGKYDAATRDKLKEIYGC